MKQIYLILIILGICGSCKTLEDASPTPRNTFIHFYEKPVNYFGNTIALTENGFILGGQTVDGFNTTGYITLIDERGNIVKELPPIDSSSVKAIKAVSDGYLVFGERIKVNIRAQQVSEVQKSRIQLIKLNKSGDMVQPPVILGDFKSNSNFTADAITVDHDGTIIGVGTLTPAGGKSGAILVALNPGTLDTLWTEIYKTDANSDRNYVNAKSIHTTPSGKIIWASSLQVQAQEKSYLTIPVVPPNSINTNSSIVNKNDDKYFTAVDIKPSRDNYGIIGTYSDTQVLPNVYFVRVGPDGSLIPNSQRYYDGIASQDNTVFDETSKNTSNSIDRGNALAATSDGGYILAGTLTQTSDRGNGGTDIWLIRVDPAGNPIWNKLIGGTGDEVVSTITEMSDGGFLITGTSTANQLSSAFIIKTDKNGDLK